MTFGKLLLFIILGYILYRFVFNFLIPVITVSRRMKHGIREFQRQQQQAAQQYQDHSQQSATTNKTEKSATPSTEKAGEYIDFEEVREK